MGEPHIINRKLPKIKAEPKLNILNIDYVDTTTNYWQKLDSMSLSFPVKPDGVAQDIFVPRIGETIQTKEYEYYIEDIVRLIMDGEYTIRVLMKRRENRKYKLIF